MCVPGAGRTRFVNSRKQAKQYVTDEEVRGGVTLELIVETPDRTPVDFGLYYRINLAGLAASYTMVPIHDGYVYSKASEDGTTEVRTVWSLSEGQRLRRSHQDWILSKRLHLMLFRCKMSTVVSCFIKAVQRRKRQGKWNCP